MSDDKKTKTPVNGWNDFSSTISSKTTDPKESSGKDLYWKRAEGPILFTSVQPAKPMGKFTYSIRKKYSFDIRYGLTFFQWIKMHFVHLAYKIHRFKTRNDREIL